MPKYYRFRATSLTRKLKRNKDIENQGNWEKVIEKSKELHETEVVLACTPVLSWYLRRTSWRASPYLMGLSRYVATMTRTLLHLTKKNNTLQGFIL